MSTPPSFATGHRTTLDAVARAAGVSIGTVSKVVNGRSGVGDWAVAATADRTSPANAASTSRHKRGLALTTLRIITPVHATTGRRRSPASPHPIGRALPSR